MLQLLLQLNQLMQLLLFLCFFFYFFSFFPFPEFREGAFSPVSVAGGGGGGSRLKLAALYVNKNGQRVDVPVLVALESEIGISTRIHTALNKEREVAGPIDCQKGPIDV